MEEIRYDSDCSHSRDARGNAIVGIRQLLMEHLDRYPSAKIIWSHEVIGIQQNDKEATVIVKTPEGEKKFSADYVVGCDGSE